MSDTNALREKARGAIGTGSLPDAWPERIWGGRGTGTHCSICGERVEANQVEFELLFPATPCSSAAADAGESHHVHGDCFLAWERERRNGALSGDDAGGIIRTHERAPTNGSRTE